jgi:hypothetical protein
MEDYSRHPEEVFRQSWEYWGVEGDSLGGGNSDFDHPLSGSLRDCPVFPPSLTVLCSNLGELIRVVGELMVTGMVT